MEPGALRIDAFPTNLKRRCKGLTRYRFVAPVMIDVYSEGPIDREEMVWFLSQNVFVSMVGLGSGVGPGESVVLPLVDWDSLRILKGGSGSNPAECRNNLERCPVRLGYPLFDLLMWKSTLTV